MNKGIFALLSEVDGILITSPYNMRYLSGFSGGEGAVWISKEKKLLLTDSRYIESAQNEAKDFTVKEAGNAILKICEEIKTEGCKTVLVEDKYLTASLYLKLTDELKDITIIPGSDKLDILRSVKTEEELKIIEEAETICCRSFEKILDFIKPGISEKNIAAELEYYMRKMGGEKTAFDTIAISGAHTSLPHGTPTDKKIEKGDFITLDFGCIKNGYCSDMTRTVVVGKASDEQKKIYNTVLEAQKVGLDAIRAGVFAKDADYKAREVIENEGYGKFFRHSLGHGVGLLVHEYPNLSPKSEVKLEENMVVSCEPGIYIPGFGGVRIEDLVAVRKNGVKNFTSSPKNLIEL